MSKVLICGHRSFVASGLTNVFYEQNIAYDCFSRGEDACNGNVITGDVLCMSDNMYLGYYDTVINFVLLKEHSVEENIKYIKSLLDFCLKNGIKRLIQISSISVYPSDLDYVDETTEIEKDYTLKGGYASIKVAVDHYLEQNKPDGLDICFVRPGFVYAKNKKTSPTGILLSKLGLHFLMGDKQTTLPLVSKRQVHNSLVKLVQLEKMPKVCLFLNKSKKISTKYRFAVEEWNVKPITLPKHLVLLVANVLKITHIFKQRHYLMVKGLFKRTWYNSEATERMLGITFDRREFAVFGAGTYGSYVSNLLSEIYPHERILLYDVGNENLKNESEIGYLSYIRKAKYEGLQKARFFGYGGASVKWGGQILMFSDNDFETPNQFMKEIVELNKKYSKKVYSRFGLKNDKPEVVLKGRLFTKTGIWLSYFHRNLFKYFKVGENLKIELVPNTRIVKVYEQNSLITGFEYIRDGKRGVARHDQYFLTAGAFESMRLLLNSGLAPEGTKVRFSDHLSQKVFKVKQKPVIKNNDFNYYRQGASLVTNRFVGEVDGYSFYSTPLLNVDFLFFQDLKELMFHRKLTSSLMMNLFKAIPSCIGFVWSLLVKNRMYVYNNEFYLQIDIEAPRESGESTLSEDKDCYGENGLNVDLTILPKTGTLFTKARDMLKDYLDECGVVYEELPFSTTAEKYEDVYHPFGMFCDFYNVNDYYSHFSNMLVLNTGVLPRAGGINSTGAVFPLIEEYVENIME